MKKSDVIVERAARKWNKDYSEKEALKFRSLETVQKWTALKISTKKHINKIDNAIAAKILQQKVKIDRAISIGCGRANLELSLIRRGIVNHFDLYEISEKALKRASDSARKMGIEDQISLHNKDVFEESIADESYDLVSWKSALHHMPDVREAVAFSRKILKKGGLFSAYEYCGPNRFQYPDYLIALATKYMELLPDELFKTSNPERPILRKKVSRIDPQRIIDNDPSESIDSENMRSAISELMPEIDIIDLGHVLTRLVFKNPVILANMDEQKSEHLHYIKTLIWADELLINQGISFNLYAMGKKE